MTADELAAMIAEEIDNNSGTRAILAKVQRGDATLEDSERFTGITAEITGRLLADHVLSLPLSDRQGAFVDITAARYRDTFSVFSAVQRALDERLGINLAVIDPGFEKARVQKAGHALADQTVPESTVVRRAESAGENIVRSQHDRIVQKQAEFRDRAGLQSSAIREGGAKCCDWCASVSGKYPASDTPQGFWSRHDNCKCSILYETKRGWRTHTGTGKAWQSRPAEDAGAPEPTRLTTEQAAELEARHMPLVLNPQVTNQSRGSRLFNDYGVSSNAPINTQSIVEDLKTSSIGREILEYIEGIEEIFIRLNNDTIRTDSNGRPIYGEEKGGEIVVYLLMCEDSERAARTIIHECTHRRYGIGQSQWAECVCFAQELKHKYKRDVLTYSEKKRIIEAVQEGYPEYKWRKGGFIYGKRQNHT